MSCDRYRSRQYRSFTTSARPQWSTSSFGLMVSLFHIDFLQVPSFFAANQIFEFIKSTKVGGSNSNTQSKAWIASITPNTIAWVSTILYRSLLGWIKGAPDRSQLEKSFTKEQLSGMQLSLHKNSILTHNMNSYIRTAKKRLEGYER